MENEKMSQHINEYIGRRITEYRLKKGLSQDALSHAIGKDSPTPISYFESGQRRVSIEDLIRIAKVLDKNLDDFLPRAATEESESKDFALKLRANYDKLDRETEKSILDFTELAKKKFRKDK